jgi:hypothetical protein
MSVRCHFRTYASQQFRGGGTASSSAQGCARALLRQWPTRRLGRRRHRSHRRRQARRALGRASGRGDQGPIRQRAADVRRPVPRLTLPHHVLGSWLFAAARTQAQQLKHDAELIAASTLLHDIGLTAAFTGEVRFEITIGSGLQLDRSSVHFSFGLKSHLVEGLIDERQGHPFRSIICDARVARRMDLSDGFRVLTRHAARSRWCSVH